MHTSFDLMKLPTNTLLGKFGLGNHIPGSGSATAFQGLLSAQLISTVITLTVKKNDYQIFFAELTRIKSEIDIRIYPRLEELFQQDSEQFDSTIQLRVSRDKEKNHIKRKFFERQSQDALKLATETLVEIGHLCVELGDSATFIFNNAFKAARGDSGVALNGSIAAIAGCLSIINLNFLSINDETWVEKTQIDTEKLKSHNERLSKIANSALMSLEKEVEGSQFLRKEIKKLEAIKLNTSKLSNPNIENIAKEVQNILWKYRNTIWKKQRPENPMEILKPNIAAEKLLGYKVFNLDSLDQYNIYGDSIKVAGIINNEKKTIGISKEFSSEVQNFTLAHELGHALLHTQTGLHRDKAIGSSNEVREQIEIQADKFATYFLMPEKTIKRLFKDVFFVEKFVINEDNVFALTGGSIQSFRLRCKNLRDLSRIIASTESIHGESFKSMSEIFNVSVETMAIRLEELELVEFDSSGFPAR